MADEEQTKVAVDAVKAGAFGYLTHPIEKEELGLIVDKVRKSDVLHSELDYLRGQFWNEDSLEYVDTRSQAMATCSSRFGKWRARVPRSCSQEKPARARA